MLGARLLQGRAKRKKIQREKRPHKRPSGTRSRPHASSSDLLQALQYIFRREHPDSRSAPRKPVRPEDSRVSRSHAAQAPQGSTAGYPSSGHVLHRVFGPTGARSLHVERSRPIAMARPRAAQDISRDACTLGVGREDREQSIGVVWILRDKRRWATDSHHGRSNPVYKVHARCD